MKVQLILKAASLFIRVEVKPTGRWQVITFNGKSYLYLEVEISPRDLKYLNNGYNYYEPIDFVHENKLELDICITHPIQECNK